MPQVFVGRSHALAVEIDGISYEVQLGSESVSESSTNLKVSSCDLSDDYESLSIESKFYVMI